MIAVFRIECSMKIAVYAISKNEEMFVERFMRGASEADGVFVLDTGSSDKTVETLKKCGAVVEKREIKPWRFDEARNLSLALVPKDVDLCVCVDLDEVLEKGWRKKIEENYVQNTKQVKYRYIWSHLADGRDGYVFWADKVHVREGFVWINPVHEVLKFVGTDYSFQYIDFRLDHYPDESKSRACYLPLLEEAVREQPENDRNMHYLGREYMFRGMFEKAIETLKKHLEMKSSVWADERSASLRFIGVCYKRLGDRQSAEKYYIKSALEAPYLREPYLYLAELYFEDNNYVGTLFACEKALKIKERSMSYINEPKCYGELPFDYASCSCCELGLYERALDYVNSALDFCPDDERLLANKKFILEKLKA